MDKQQIQDLVTNFSIETTVREAGRIESYADLVRPGTELYIPHVPGTAPHETVALAARLRREGMEPVPHIVARRIESATALDEWLARFVGEAGVRQVLVVAGDIAQPIGEFESALQILERGFIEKHGIRKVGVAGHPEGHKDISEPVLREALVRKNEYASKTGADVYVVTQFVFLPAPIIAWEAGNGPINRLPYRAGLPGLATLKTLLKYAIDCGAGPSLQAISKHATNLTKLLTVSAPDELLVGLADYRRQHPHTRLQGVHFFPFGGLKRTAEWLTKIAQGDFEFTSKGSGFDVA
jgi:methylenetetrahydrofolate reductase (NADPH)